MQPGDARGSQREGWAGGVEARGYLDDRSTLEEPAYGRTVEVDCSWAIKAPAPLRGGVCGSFRMPKR